MKKAVYNNNIAIFFEKYLLHFVLFCSMKVVILFIICKFASLQL